MGAACCSSVLLTEVDWGQCSPGQVGRRALLIPLPFLFQRARQMDEELSRRGSPIPKKVQWFSSQEILFLGSLAFIPGRSHSVSAGRCTGSFFEALEVLSQVPGRVYACDKSSSFPGRGRVAEGVPSGSTAGSQKVFSMQRKGRPPGQSLSNDRGVSGMAA